MEKMAARNGFSVPSGRYYVIAEDGVYSVSENRCLRAHTKAKSRFSLRVMEEGAEWKLGHLPGRLVYRAIAFLREIRQRHGTEALIWIYYDFGHECYELKVPKQTASSIRVFSDDLIPTPENWLKVGSIHSHMGKKAGHSGGDTRDELHYCKFRLSSPNIPG